MVHRIGWTAETSTKDHFFAVYYTQPRRPYPKEQELVRVSTYLAGIAIERRRSEEALQARAHQQALVAELGQSALTGGDLPTLMHNAVSLIAQTLEVEYCKVLELLADGKEMILRAGFGCPADAVNHITVGAGLDSQAGYTLVSDEPVVVEDLRTETRFSGPPLLHQLGVISGMSVIISGKPHYYGVLGVHSTQLRRFTRDDIHFVQAVANVVALAIERKQAEEVIRASEERYRTLVESSPFCIHEIDLNGQLISMNPAGLRMMGVTSESEVIGRPYLTAVSEDDQERVGKLLALACKGESSNFKFRAVNGRHFQSYFVPINNDKGTIVKLMGLTQDITEEKLAKEALRYLSGRVIQAQEEERRHVARELHDDIGQRLALIAVDTQLLILADQQPKPEILAQLKNLRSQVETLSSDVHNLSHQLHPANLEQLGLITALKSFFRDMERKGRVIEIS